MSDHSVGLVPKRLKKKCKLSWSRGMKFQGNMQEILPPISMVKSDFEIASFFSYNGLKLCCKSAYFNSIICDTLNF